MDPVSPKKREAWHGCRGAGGGREKGRKGGREEYPISGRVKWKRTADTREVHLLLGTCVFKNGSWQNHVKHYYYDGKLYLRTLSPFIHVPRIECAKTSHASARPRKDTVPQSRGNSSCFIPPIGNGNSENARFTIWSRLHLWSVYQGRLPSEHEPEKHFHPNIFTIKHYKTKLQKTSQVSKTRCWTIHDDIMEQRIAFDFSDRAR